MTLFWRHHWNMLINISWRQNDVMRIRKLNERFRNRAPILNPLCICQKGLNEWQITILEPTFWLGSPAYILYLTTTKRQFVNFNSFYKYVSYVLKGLFQISNSSIILIQLSLLFAPYTPHFPLCIFRQMYKMHLFLCEKKKNLFSHFCSQFQGFLKSLLIFSLLKQIFFLHNLDLNKFIILKNSPPCLKNKLQNIYKVNSTMQINILT